MLGILKDPVYVVGVAGSSMPYLVWQIPERESVLVRVKAVPSETWSVPPDMYLGVPTVMAVWGGVMSMLMPLPTLTVDTLPALSWQLPKTDWPAPSVETVEPGE